MQEILTAIIIMLFPSQGTCELHFYMLFPWFDHSPLNMDFLKHSWRKHHKMLFLKEGRWFFVFFLVKMQKILLPIIFFNLYN